MRLDWFLMPSILAAQSTKFSSLLAVLLNAKVFSSMPLGIIACGLYTPYIFCNCSFSALELGRTIAAFWRTFLIDFVCPRNKYILSGKVSFRKTHRETDFMYSLVFGESLPKTNPDNP